MNPEITNIINQLKSILDDALFLNGQSKNWNNQIPLLGNIPELDSMSIMNVVAALKINFGIFIEDEDINAEVFATIESLAIFINEKLVLDQIENVR